MLRIRIIYLALVAVFALSAVAASSAVAVPHFRTSHIGAILGTGGEQVFTDEAGGTPVKCTAAHATGNAEALEETVTKQLVLYTGCKASIDTVHQIHATYLIHANGEVDIDGPIAIKVEGIGACEIVVEAQKGLKELLFDNNAAKTEITALAHVGGIKSKGSGGLCGGSHTGGTYTGNVTSKLVEVGELEWVKS
jgi:hypothetical protein